MSARHCPDPGCAYPISVRDDNTIRPHPWIKYVHGWTEMTGSLCWTSDKTITEDGKVQR